MGKQENETQRGSDKMRELPKDLMVELHDFTLKELRTKLEELPAEYDEATLRCLSNRCTITGFELDSCPEWVVWFHTDTCKNWKEYKHYKGGISK